MSRGFVKEDDREEAPIIPPRAALPVGATNYVTKNGLEQLQIEREELEEERTNLSRDNDTEHRRELTVINGKLELLQERIATARVLNLEEQPQDEVRFGATVSYKNLGTKAVNIFQIVGVDEADIKQKKIAFVAPIAIALTGAKVGDIVDFQLGPENRKLEILNIEYK